MITAYFIIVKFETGVKSQICAILGSDIIKNVWNGSNSYSSKLRKKGNFIENGE